MQIKLLSNSISKKNLLKNKIITKYGYTCENCNKKFLNDYRLKRKDIPRFCSKSCSGQFRGKQNQKSTRTELCENCGKSLTILKSVRKIEYLCESCTFEKLHYVGPHICERCGKEYEYDYRKDRDALKTPSRFCSKKCANTHVLSNETKSKISSSVKSSEKAKKANIKEHLKRQTREWKNLHRLPRIKKVCPVCSKEFETTESRNKIYCSTNCWNKKSGGYREGSGRSKAGYYKGIYCGSTYELCWVIYNLDNNISFEKSKTQIPYIYQGEEHIYYPDFELENGTLIEIKGYYTDQVKAKTEAAKSLGYNIQVLYEKDLKYAFDYVKEKYKVFDFAKLYDLSKKIYTYTCDCCGKEFKRTKEVKTGLKFCSRNCSGKYIKKFH